jgi:hypothetical protein
VRQITKLSEPCVLAEKAASWTTAYLADPANGTKRYRYRHPDIKHRLKQETSAKCVYCESKIGHNTPGDVEHKIPTSVRQDLHFCWDNLTIACTECNRRKRDFFDSEKPFLDPYSNDIERRICHLGPIVSWCLGDSDAEISIKILKLNTVARLELFIRKAEMIDALNNLAERIRQERGPLREVLRAKLREMRSRESEYSGMIDSICKQYKID